jgi:hypothetical protein
MHHFATTLCAGITVTVLFGGAALTPTAVEAARTSNVEKLALKETTAACKAEPKEKKISGQRAGSS